jgi:predicted O-methyltransferase YrrM
MTHIYSIIRQHQPRRILELGSGSSSVLIAYMLEQMNGGKLVSLDHDQRFAEKTRQMHNEHELNDRTEVHWAPLTRVNISGQTYEWYDLERIPFGDEPFDMLIIDGPPLETQPQARYPALPMLYARLSSSALIILDDASRKDELTIIDRWLQAYPEFTLQHLDSAKGLALLRRERQGQSSGDKTPVSSKKIKAS